MPLQEYKADLPDFICLYLVEKGNKFNRAASGPTFLEVMLSTKQIEAAFASKKRSMKWTVASIGQAELEKKKYSMANSFFPKRWSSKRDYERASIFLRLCEDPECTVA